MGPRPSARTDRLTGLPDREAFVATLRNHEGTPGSAVFVVDLDRFMYVNGSVGLHRGDELIRSVADALGAALRPGDALARLGGDVFGVVAPGCDAQQAEAVARALLDAVHDVPIDRLRPELGSMTASVGLALLDGTADADAVLIAADVAMHDAKADGRDRWSMAAPDTPTSSRTMSAVTWVERIREALSSGALQLYAQPIMELATGSVNQCELLLRMQGEDGSVVLPGEFLAIAEQLDLIQRIDRWVTEAAIDYLRVTPDVTVEVNLSGATLGDATLLELIKHRLHDGLVDPRRLVFEITETAAIANIHDAHEFAATLARIGCRFALDDFGAGFGSFYYVKHLPVDFVKIDGEFIAGATVNPTDRTIVRSIVTIAHELGKSTIAEHTHDAATLELLRELGVDHAQGFHIGRPVPLAAWRPTARV